MVRDEWDKGSVIAQRTDRAQIVIHVVGVTADGTAFGGPGDRAFRLRDSKVETVDGRIVLLRYRIRVPDFRHRIETGGDVPQFPQIPVPEIHVRRVIVQIEILGGVEAEAVHTLFQIETRDVQQFRTDGVTSEIEFRHVRGEVALHHLLRVRDPVPGAPARLVVRITPGVEVVERISGVPVPVRGLKTGKPGVLRTGMVDGQIQDELDPAFMAGGDQGFQISHRPECGINGIVVGYVIFVIGGGEEYRRQPDPFHAEAETGIGIAVVQVIQTVQDPAQITDAVSVRVGERADKNLIEHPVVVGYVRGGNQTAPGQTEFAVWRLFRGNVFLRGDFRRRLTPAASCAHSQQDCDKDKTKNLFRRDHLREDSIGSSGRLSRKALSSAIFAAFRFHRKKHKRLTLAEAFCPFRLSEYGQTKNGSI